MISINTNVGAMIALQNLNKTNDMLDHTQLRVSTGLKVNSARDDAASYAISQKMRSDVNGYEAVKVGLNLADATIGVAVRAGQTIEQLLGDMKAKAVQAQSGGLGSADLQALNNDVQAMVAQVNTIVNTALFNDVNLIDTDSSDLTILSSVDGNQTITVSARSMSPADIGLGGTTRFAGPTVSINNLDLTTVNDAAIAADSINLALSSVLSSLANFGSIQNQISAQLEFTSNLTDIVTSGVGVMVDADMARESASLQALQIKQQLGAQTLGIANSSPQTILSLFGN